MNLPTLRMNPDGAHLADIYFCWMSVCWLKWLLAGVSSAHSAEPTLAELLFQRGEGSPFLKYILSKGSCVQEPEGNQVLCPLFSVFKMKG